MFPAFIILITFSLRWEAIAEKYWLMSLSCLLSRDLKYRAVDGFIATSIKLLGFRFLPRRCSDCHQAMLQLRSTLLRPPPVFRLLPHKRMPFDIYARARTSCVAMLQFYILSLWYCDSEVLPSHFRLQICRGSKFSQCLSAFPRVLMLLSMMPRAGICHT